MKSVQIQSFSSFYFLAFGLNMEIYGVNICIHSEYRKIRTRKNSVFGHFSRSVNNTSIGLPDSRTEWFIIRALDSHCKNPGFSFLEGKPLSTFLDRGFKFLDKVTRDVFIPTKF